MRATRGRNDMAWLLKGFVDPRGALEARDAVPPREPTVAKLPPAPIHLAKNSTHATSWPTSNDCILEALMFV